MMTPSSKVDAKAERAQLILFTTGDAPRSRRARANLADALRRCGRDPAATQEIDLVRDPAQTFAYGIFATPALLRVSDDAGPEVLYGDLSEPQALERFLAFD